MSITDFSLRLVVALFTGFAIVCIATTGLFIETVVCLVIIVYSFINPIEKWLKNRR